MPTITAQNTLTATIEHANTCLPCYYSGAGDTLTEAVAVDGSSTIGEVLTELAGGDWNAESWTDEQERAFTRAIAELRHANADQLNALFDTALETPTNDDTGDSVYAYFHLRFTD